MLMKNIKVVAKSETYFVVLADTERFGKQEVMFEGNTWDQCFQYVKRELGKKPGENLTLRSYLLFEVVTDRNGEAYPFEVSVVA